MDEFIGEIGLFAFNFAPRGWAFCQGQLLPINQNQALFAILGTNYGGDGRTTFALPNLVGRSAMGVGQGGGLTTRSLGEVTGTATNTLLISQLPAHTHAINGTITLPAASQIGNQPSPVAAFFAIDGTQKYDTQHDGITMQPATLNLTGGITGNGIPITNMKPYLVINYCICLAGIFPTRN